MQANAAAFAIAGKLWRPLNRCVAAAIVALDCNLELCVLTAFTQVNEISWPAEIRLTL